MVGHMHEKVDRDLFAMVGNLKKIKNCPTQEVSFFCGQKFHQMPTKTGISFGSFILELKRIPGGEFEIYSKSGWFSGILNQIQLFGSARTFYKKSILDLQWLGFNGSTTQGNFCFSSC
jgi:hypothetical protein